MAGSKHYTALPFGRSIFLTLCGAYGLVPHSREIIGILEDKCSSQTNQGR